MKHFLLFVMFFSTLATLKAQRNLNDSLTQKARKNLYFEIGGSSIAPSIVGESRFNSGPKGWGMKLGFGAFAMKNYYTILTVPFQINYLGSGNNRDFFEAGAGVSFLYYKDQEGVFYYGPPIYRPSPQLPVDVVEMKITKERSLYGTLTLGYRRQPRKGGWMWGIALTPHFNETKFWPWWMGVKFGYSFKH